MDVALVKWGSSVASSFMRNEHHCIRADYLFLKNVLVSFVQLYYLKIFKALKNVSNANTDIADVLRHSIYGVCVKEIYPESIWLNK